MKILFSPIHYVLDAQNSGSEFSWAYEIYQGISRQSGIEAFYVTGGVRGINNHNIINCQIFNPQKIDLSLKNVLRFYFKVYFISRKLNRLQGFDLIHHILPFYIGKSFNLFAPSSRKKFLLGPIQSPLTYLDKDLTTKSARGFEKSKIHPLRVLENSLIFLFKPLLHFLSLQTLKRADKIIVVNTYTRNLLLTMGVIPEKIQVIPVGIDTSKFDFVPFSEKRDDVTELITVGILLKRKGVELIIKALGEILKTNKNVRLRIVGDGPQMGYLREETKRYNLTKNVIFQGFIPNQKISKFYQKAHIFVSMSRAESWGQMYLEAMASGLPIVATKNVGSNEIVKDGEVGYLVEQEDYQQLAEKVIYLIKNPDLVAILGRRAREKVQKFYDWDKAIIPKYLKIYETLAV